MILKEDGKYYCPVCDGVSSQVDSVSRQREACSVECGRILKRVRELSRLKKDNKNLDSYLLNTQTKLYSVWNSMKQRCGNPNHKSFRNYGGKGVTVCDSWKDKYIEFGKWALANGYRETEGKLSADTLSIDRINPSGDYEPGNCRFISHAENSGLVVNGMNKEIHVYKINGKYVGSYVSASEAGRKLGLTLAHLAECIEPTSSRKQVGGYRFSLVLVDTLPIDSSIRNTGPIEGFDSNGRSVGIFNKKKDACDALGVTAPSNISAVLNGKRPHTKGFTFKYV